jgi:hypothetical protein
LQASPLAMINNNNKTCADDAVVSLLYKSDS